MMTMTSPAMDIGLPEKIQFFDHVSHIEIVRTWFGMQTLFLTGFAVIWAGFLFFWYSNVPADGELMFVLFPLIHVGVGFVIAYIALTGWFNRTQLTVGQGKIGVRHGPLPWPGNKEIDAHDVKQLYGKEKISRSRNSTSVSYELRAVTKSGRNIKLVGGLESQEQAIFIEQKIEKYLRIEDVAIPGEIHK